MNIINDEYQLASIINKYQFLYTTYSTTESRLYIFRFLQQQYTDIMIIITISYSSYRSK